MGRALVNKNKIAKAANSRTVWTIIAMFVLNGLSAVRQDIPAEFLGYVDFFLSVLALYFHTNPRQNFNK